MALFGRGRDGPAARGPGDAAYRQALALREAGRLDDSVLALRDAADAGHAGAAYELGRQCRDGDGLPRNHDQAIRWFRRAAALGHPQAGRAWQALGGTGDPPAPALGSAAGEAARADAGCLQACLFAFHLLPAWCAGRRDDLTPLAADGPHAAPLAASEQYEAPLAASKQYEAPLAASKQYEAPLAALWAEAATRTRRALGSGSAWSSAAAMPPPVAAPLHGGLQLRFATPDDAPAPMPCWAWCAPGAGGRLVLLESRGPAMHRHDPRRLLASIAPDGAHAVHGLVAPDLDGETLARLLDALCAPLPQALPGVDPLGTIATIEHVGRYGALHELWRRLGAADTTDASRPAG